LHEYPSKYVDAKFAVFERTPISKPSRSGCWYHLKSPVGGISFDVHILSSLIMTPNDLTGFNSTGNIRIWPSEEYLAYYLLQNQAIVRDKSVLELGAGMVGLSGLTSARLGAHEVVLTDGNEKSVKNAQLIVDENLLGDRVSCCVLSWTCTLPRNDQFDLILCADCLFFTEEHRNLLDCTYQHLKPCGSAYFLAPDRAGTAKIFLDCLYGERRRWNSVSVNFHVQDEAKLMSENDIHVDDQILIILRK
uniref:Calmodulin-lysine N-methyltransferase n=1 Tax=Gongylonema pulchrum TaxID=637853 RepID=A0A183DKJ0_9BILA